MLAFGHLVRANVGHLVSCLAAGAGGIDARGARPGDWRRGLTARESIDLAAGSPSAAIAAWRIGEAHLEYLVLCDCSVLLGDHTGRSDEITDRRLDDLVDLRLRALSQDLVSECDAAGELLAIRRATVEAGRNIPGGFWCCQNEPEAAEHALTGRHALSGLRGAVLATDGATRGLHLLPSTHDLDGLVTRALDGAHSSILSEIRAAEHAASAALTARAIKVHDDATLVSLSMPGERTAQRRAIRRL
jgi:hypothetical protein